MILGLRCTNYSAEVYAEDESEETSPEKKTGKDKILVESSPEEKPGQDKTPVESSPEKKPGQDKTPEKSSAGKKPGKDAAMSEMPEAEKPGQDKTLPEVSEAESPVRDRLPSELSDAEKSGQEGAAAQKKESSAEQILTAVVMVASFALAIGLFMVLPYFLASNVVKLTGSAALLSLFEGIIRITIFVCYILLISQMKDIRRLFQYHGAEHKCINCLENGNALTVENAMRASRLHKRCGSSFILFVMMVSIILFFFIRVRNPIARVGLRILLLPVISGISYELIRFAGSSDNPVIAILSRPGLWLQGLTTKEPDAEMVAVAIQSVEAVFDWRAYLDTDPADQENTCR
ncbi:MAG: DUF1385 domain-containing protein [Eubacteriales bacterium]|nr:DUF1385 domain-containing protein [Eubacteriales bacterium]